MNTSFIDVTAKFEANSGRVIPLSFIYGDKVIEIDKILDIRPAASLKHGGQGIRYTCKTHNITYYLFYEDDKWFIEFL